MNTASIEVPQARRREFGNANTLKLGLFGPNCSSGRTPTNAPERWSGDWADNLRLARIADEAGIDFLLPIGRWKGYGGNTDYQGTTLEVITWAAGILASTRRIHAFATVHVPLVHPVIAAKQFVTVDHISEGRFGLNIVCGWNEDEFEMFGVTQREHEARYEYAQEWFDAVRRMWGEEEDFSVEGRFIKLKKVRSKPKPYGGSRPIVMNAGASPTGQAFAIRNCDALFTGLSGKPDFEAVARLVADAKGRAAEGGRDLDVYTVGVVTCKPTLAEAEACHQHRVVEQADWGAVDTMMRLHKVPTAGLAPEALQKLRAAFANGSGAYQLIGEPDYVAAELARLSAAGIKGIAVSFLNYAEELPYFCQEVLPRLERLGLRVKPQPL